MGEHDVQQGIRKVGQAGGGGAKDAGRKLASGCAKDSQGRDCGVEQVAECGATESDGAESCEEVGPQDESRSMEQMGEVGGGRKAWQADDGNGMQAVEEAVDGRGMAVLV